MSEVMQVVPQQTGEVVRAEQLGKTYAEGDLHTPVFDGLDFRVSAGETVAILGASGATGLLPPVHQLIESTRGLPPLCGILERLGFGDDLLLGGFGPGAFRVAFLSPFPPALVERRPS